MTTQLHKAPKQSSGMKVDICAFEHFVAQLAEGEAADGVFADASEIERAVAFDDVGDLGVAVGGVVLEVVDDAALLIQAEDE